MRLPKNLVVGDTVAIVSTARKIDKIAIQKAILQLEEWGFHVKIGRTIGLAYHQYAGTDLERAYDFQTMLDDPTVKAIWCARGGYGTVRIIDQLDFTTFKKQPKWIIGYSDVTVLHAHIHRFKIATMHAVMPVDFHKATAKAKVSLRKAIVGEHLKYKISPHQQNRLGMSEGKLIGGNLSILYSLCGSPSQIEATGKILCIEDLDEYVYHIDRMLMNLKRNGYFKGLKGLIIGGMTKMHDNTIPFGKTVNDIILDIVAPYDFPVVFDFPMGHISDNRTLIMGAEIRLQVTEEAVHFEHI